MNGPAFAWHAPHSELVCAGVNRLAAMISKSPGAAPGASASIAATCRSPGPWHVSQLMPGSTHSVR